MKSHTKFMEYLTDKDFLKSYKLGKFIASGGFGSVYKGEVIKHFLGISH